MFLDIENLFLKVLMKLKFRFLLKNVFIGCFRKFLFFLYNIGLEYNELRLKIGFVISEIFFVIFVF